MIEWFASVSVESWCKFAVLMAFACTIGALRYKVYQENEKRHRWETEHVRYRDPFDP